MPDPLFTKLELIGDGSEGETPTKEDSDMDEGSSDIVTFEEFMKLDLRVARILDAEDHPNADKLYVLKVDIGESEPRTLIAGLRKYYKKEDMVGKTIIVVSNLKPAKMRGIVSNGMLLAAEADGSVILLTTDSEIEPGAKIH
jgi:methionyl-tRNA synthetase